MRRRSLSHTVQRRKRQMSYQIVAVASVDGIERQWAVEKKNDDVARVLLLHMDDVDGESDENDEVEDTIHFERNYNRDEIHPLFQYLFIENNGYQFLLLIFLREAASP